MKIDDVIIRYLDNQLNDQEKHEFEKELDESAELKSRYETVKGRLSLLKSASAPEADENYFNNIIPEFRKRAEAGKKRSFGFGRVYKFAFGAAVVIILALMLTLNNSKTPTVDLSDLNSDEITTIYNMYSSDENLSYIPEKSEETVSQKIDSLITEDYILADSSVNYLDRNDYNSMIASLTDEEADEIYNQLINKNFLPGGEQ